MIDINTLQENWAVVTGFVAGAVAWGKTAVTSSSARESATKAHERINDTQKDVADIRECVGKMGAHYEHTMKSIDEIKRKLEAQQPAQP